MTFVDLLSVLFFLQEALKKTVDATVHLCITSHEHPNLQFLMNSQSNRVCTQSNRVGILFDCRY